MSYSQLFDLASWTRQTMLYYFYQVVLCKSCIQDLNKIHQMIIDYPSSSDYLKEILEPILLQFYNDIYNSEFC